MDLSNIKRRLTEHLAQEASLDMHTQEARLDAIQEAQEYISERWALNLAVVPPGGAEELPDFYSYAPHMPGYYNKRPAVLTDGSEPWNGQYPQLHRLISYYAAFCLYRDKGPEMYERSQFWLELFEKMVTSTVERTLNRRHIQALQQEQQPGTFGALMQSVGYDLDTSAMTPEEANRIFPLSIRQEAIRRAYLEITVEHELSISSAKLQVVNSTQTDEGSIDWTLPEDFIAPMNQIALSSTSSIVGGEYPFSRASSYAPTFEILTDNGLRKIRANHLPQVAESITIRYLSRPPALVNQTDKPWNGEYPTGDKLIVLRAMRDLMRGKKELYQLSRFWQNEYDREVTEFKKLLKRKSLGQANRVIWGHTSAGIADQVIDINWPDRLKNYVEWM